MNWKTVALVAGGLLVAANAAATGFLIMRDLNEAHHDYAAQIGDIQTKLAGRDLGAFVLAKRVDDLDRRLYATEVKVLEANKSAVEASASAERAHAAADRARAKALEPCIINGIC